MAIEAETEFYGAVGVLSTGSQAPVLAGTLKATVSEGGTYVFTAGTLGYTDSDSVAADEIFTVSNISGGTILLSGVEASSFTGADIKAGLVSYVHNGEDDTPGGFDVTVTDQTNLSASGTFSFTVTPVNDAPVLYIGDTPPNVEEGGSYTFGQADIYGYDTDDVPAGITFTVSNVTHGWFVVNGIKKNTFTERDVENNGVVFVHNGDEAATAGFDIKVEDGNEDHSTPTVSHFALNVDAIDDPAKVTGNLTGKVREILSPTVSGKLAVSDADSGTTFAVVKDQASDGGYGTFSITATGQWTYRISADSHDVDQLSTGETLEDQLTVQTAGGDLVQIAVTIQGTSNAIGSAGSDAGEDALIGTAVQDYMSGLAGNDLIRGLAGDDLIYGGAGNDLIYGDDVKHVAKGGKDLIVGGAGRDQMWGGGGADTFVFAKGDTALKAAARDIVRDFTHSEHDIIDLSAIDANAKTAKDDAFKIYTVEKTALATVGALFMDVHGKDITLYLNTDSHKGYELAIDVVSATRLAAGDFHL